MHGERAGFNNTPWDMQFLELIEKDPERLTEMTQAEYAALGGMEGAEVIMWLVMRGAMSSSIRKIHQTYYLPSMTGIATAIYENEAVDTPVDTLAAHRAHIGRELAGVEKLEGTYPFTLARSVKGYRLNKFLHALVEPAHRAKFLADPEGAFAEAGLTDEERAMVRKPRLARPDPLRRDLLHAREARCGRRRLEPAHLCRDAGPVVGGFPEDPQRTRRALLGRRQGGRSPGLGRGARQEARLSAAPRTRSPFKSRGGSPCN